MAGLFSSISSFFTGGDSRLVDQIEAFANGYLSYGEVGRGLTLQRNEQVFLAALLAEELYRGYCAVEAKRQCDPTALEHLEGVRRARAAAIGTSTQSLDRFEIALRAVAVDLAGLARERGKFAQRFATADGMSESLVQPIVSAHAGAVRGIKRERVV